MQLVHYHSQEHGESGTQCGRVPKAAFLRLFLSGSCSRPTLASSSHSRQLLQAPSTLRCARGLTSPPSSPSRLSSNTSSIDSPQWRHYKGPELRDQYQSSSLSSWLIRVMLIAAGHLSFPVVYFMYAAPELGAPHGIHRGADCLCVGGRAPSVKTLLRWVFHCSC